MEVNRFQYWGRWTLACGLGELVGIGVAGALAVGFAAVAGEPATMGAKILNLVVMLLAGALEGTVLGSLQWRVLRLKFPSVPAREWITYTVMVAVLGWFLGMMPSLFAASGPAENADMPEMPLFLFLMTAAAMGLVLGGLFGLFQWFVFRRYARHTRSWILGNALGWALAMTLIFIAASWPDASTPKALIIAGGVGGGILAGLSIGAITGLFLLRIIERQEEAGATP